jgi:hypothetical protein
VHAVECGLNALILGMQPRLRGDLCSRLQAERRAGGIVSPLLGAADVPTSRSHLLHSACRSSVAPMEMAAACS